MDQWRLDIQASLEDLYAQLALEDEGEGGVIVKKGEVREQQTTYVLVGRFLTEKNINFNAMQNVLASLWRPREGMEFHDLGGHRYSFVFYHILDMQKVLDGGPWTFEQSLLVYHILGENEDPHLVNLNKSDIWVQAYDIPKGLISEHIFMNVGNFVGKFVKSDSNNLSGGWRMYARIRITMDMDKPIKRRMKIKREGGDWSWVNFKYERLSTFCFVCGMMGHSDRDCSLVYANLEKDIVRAYGVWLRAPLKNTNTQNMGAKWIRNSTEGSQTWEQAGMRSRAEATVPGSPRVETRFMEVDGKISENLGEDGGIMIVQRNQGKEIGENNFLNQIAGSNVGGNILDNDTVVTDPKRKRVDKEDIMDQTVEEITTGPVL